MIAFCFQSGFAADVPLEEFRGFGTTVENRQREDSFQHPCRLRNPTGFELQPAIDSGDGLFVTIKLMERRCHHEIGESAVVQFVEALRILECRAPAFRTKINLPQQAENGRVLRKLLRYLLPHLIRTLCVAPTQFVIREDLQQIRPI